MYHHYIDDILIGGETRAEVHTAMDSVLQILTKLGLDVPDSKEQGTSHTVTFLGM